MKDPWIPLPAIPDWSPDSALPLYDGARYDLLCRKWNPRTAKFEWQRFTDCCFEWDEGRPRWYGPSLDLNFWRPEAFTFPPDLPEATG